MGATGALELYAAFSARAEQDAALREALETVDAALRRYGPARVAVAFNGGKDATVVMHLARAATAAWARENGVRAAPPLRCLYLLGEGGCEFPEVEAFVRAQAVVCGLEIAEVCMGFKEGIEVFKRDRGLCAFIMGTRRHDPHGAQLTHFSPSSPGWPAFMRVNPVLTWGYQDVWRFLRTFRLPYCAMYDRGYTSIGVVEDTVPNPHLRVEAADGTLTYLPAWKLEDGSMERAGRLKKVASSADRSAVKKAKSDEPADEEQSPSLVITASELDTGIS